MKFVSFVAHGASPALHGSDHRIGPVIWRMPEAERPRCSPGNSATDRLVLFLALRTDAMVVSGGRRMR